jgi:hypothetical protein
LVLGEIIDRVYHQNLSTASSQPLLEMFKAIIDCEQSLARWKESLSPERSLISDPAEAMCYENPINVPE